MKKYQVVVKFPMLLSAETPQKAKELARKYAKMSLLPISEPKIEGVREDNSEEARKEWW